MRFATQTLYESAVAFGIRKALQTEQGKSEMESRITQLEADVKDLERQVTRVAPLRARGWPARQRGSLSAHPEGRKLRPMEGLVDWVMWIPHQLYNQGSRNFTSRRLVPGAVEFPSLKSMRGHRKRCKNKLWLHRRRSTPRGVRLRVAAVTYRVLVCRMSA